MYTCKSTSEAYTYMYKHWISLQTIAPDSMYYTCTCGGEEGGGPDHSKTASTAWSGAYTYFNNQIQGYSTYITVNPNMHPT